ncbi:uncharacterized protein DS421_9g259180 [Arachis hypogaea]|nr:uncharacterized protein DS421_9g259180 [Arachis hypogaea]
MKHQGLKVLLGMQARRDGSDWCLLVTKEGPEIIACWLMHSVSSPLSLAEPVCMKKKKFSLV